MSDEVEDLEYAYLELELAITRKTMLTIFSRTFLIDDYSLH